MNEAIQALIQFYRTHMRVERDRNVLIEAKATHGLTDVHFFRVELPKEANEEGRRLLFALLKETPDAARLSEGPNYMGLGAVWGDQGFALQTMALGELVGLWKVVTPRSLGMVEPMASRMAGGGMVLVTGYRPENVR